MNTSARFVSALGGYSRMISSHYIFLLYLLGTITAFIQEPKSPGGVQEVKINGAMAQKENKQFPIHHGIEPDGGADIQ